MRPSDRLRQGYYLRSPAIFFERSTARRTSGDWGDFTRGRRSTNRSLAREFLVGPDVRGYRDGDRRVSTERSKYGAVAERRRNPFVFAALFLGLAIVFHVAASTELADRHLGEPICLAVATISAALLSPFGSAAVDGTRLVFDGFRVVVAEPCNGILPTTLYLAAVLAFPSTWRARLYGILIGIPGIFLVNVLRVVSLMIVGARSAAIFEDVHVYVWQTLVVALTVALWVFWVERFVRPEKALPSGA
jgi:exosortase H (IPTLxxWG-CTERM-specific)